MVAKIAVMKYLSEPGSLTMVIAGDAFEDMTQEGQEKLDIDECVSVTSCIYFRNRYIIFIESFIDFRLFSVMSTYRM